ncbi:MAG: aspartate aminotransferase family protein [Candidatus Velthaea sp.]
MIVDMDCALAGGASSPVRAGRAVGGTPFVQSRGDGAYAYDAHGRRYIDYVMAYGPLLLGHAHPALTTGLTELAARGTVFGSTCPGEAELAERMRGHLPSMERVRFTTTGSEAVMSAVRVARAFTGRDVVLKFSGNYHGHFDAALLDAGASAHTVSAAAAGIPRSVASDVVVARYNDLDSVERATARCSDRLAAILVEPVVGNMGLVVPNDGFLAALRAHTHACGALLIFDEVITWLRLGLNGAQARAGVRPDLTAVGKIVGGGLPLAAFGGRRDVMALLAPDGPAFTGGTHAGNPLAVAVALRVLDWLESHPGAYAVMERQARRLAGGLRAELAALNLDYAVVQLASIVDFKFRSGPRTRDYDDMRRADPAAFAAFYHAMRQRGVLLAPSQNEVMFLSTEHSDADIDATLDAAHASLRELRAGGIV